MEYNASNDRYTRIEYKRCGNSGLLLPLLSLGLWHNFGNVDDAEEAKKMLFYAFDHGITHFDLANNYGHPAGSAEENFGKILSKEFKNYRDEMIVSTKAGYKMWDGPYGEWGSRKYLISSINQSLKRLNLDYVDIFYSHRFDPYTPLEETILALDQIVKSGKALYVGISNYDEKQTKQAIDLLEELGTPFIIHQTRYNILQRQAEYGLFNLLEEEGKGCIVYSALSQGILTDKYLTGIPENSRAAKEHGFLQTSQVTKELIEIVKKLNEIARERDQSLSQMALSWVLRNKAVTSALIGVSSLIQLETNFKALENLHFSKEELDKIDQILSDGHNE